MFENATANPMIAVKDIAKAREFYAKTLGLKVDEEKDEQMAICHVGPIDFVLYESEYAGTNKANTLAWSLGEKFDEVMSELKSKGIRFEHYDDLPGMKLEGDVHVSGNFKAAWFKDPDGNILHVNNMPGSH